MDITIKTYQEQVDGWVKTHGVRYFDEMTNLGILTEEPPAIPVFSSPISPVWPRSRMPKASR